MNRIWLIIIFGFAFIPNILCAAYTPYISSFDLLEKYFTGQPVKVLIVPGHDEESPGAAFNGVREVDQNRFVAEQIYNYFKTDPHFVPVITQMNGDYVPEIKTYLENNRQEIEEWMKDQKREMRKYVRQGKIVDHDSLAHGTATTETALRLYGINKWANENDVDLIIHVHFNDYGGRKWNQVGEYSGFSIYIPENQFGNGEVSKRLGDTIYNRLAKVILPGDMPGEAETLGAIEDQDLIAIGANNTLVSASVLIEYSYIYEPWVQSIFFEDIGKILAYETYAAVDEYFKADEFVRFLPSKFSYTWSEDRYKISDLNKANPGLSIQLLQMALRREGVYPPRERARVECPITAKFGECTELALKDFQTKNNLPATGVLGPQTRKILNSLY